MLETIKVTAYNRGNFVGSQQYDLTTSLQQINFPANWGTVTRGLVLDTNTGTLVLYALQVQPIYRQPLSGEQGCCRRRQLRIQRRPNSTRAGHRSVGWRTAAKRQLRAKRGPNSTIYECIDPLDGVQRPPVSAPNANKNPGPTVHY